MTHKDIDPDKVREVVQAASSFEADEYNALHVVEIVAQSHNIELNEREKLAAAEDLLDA